MKIVLEHKTAWAMIKSGRKYLSTNQYPHWTDIKHGSRWVDKGCALATWNRIKSNYPSIECANI